MGRATWGVRFGSVFYTLRCEMYLLSKNATASRIESSWYPGTSLLAFSRDRWERQEEDGSGREQPIASDNASLLVAI